jgi:hypothetical protein
VATAVVVAATVAEGSALHQGRRIELRWAPNAAAAAAVGTANSVEG